MTLRLLPPVRLARQAPLHVVGAPHEVRWLCPDPRVSRSPSTHTPASSKPLSGFNGYLITGPVLLPFLWLVTTVLSVLPYPPTLAPVRVELSRVGVDLFGVEENKSSLKTVEVFFCRVLTLDLCQTVFTDRGDSKYGLDSHLLTSCLVL